jgi:hypothetical protein
MRRDRPDRKGEPMPLPSAAPRRELHHRAIECRGYAREDGLYDVEARLTDRRHFELRRKTGDVSPAGSVVHDMWLRLTVGSDLVIHDVIAATDTAPYAACPNGAVMMRKLVGERIGRGFTKRTRELLGGALGCTHLVELLGPAATTAYQTLVEKRMSSPDVLDARGRPVKLDSCLAYAADGDIARQLWPQLATPRE